MKKAYLITMKEVFNDTEKYIFLDKQKANDYFKKCIIEAFKINETEKDDDGYTIEECLQAGTMESDPYTVTLEELEVIN